MWEQGQKTFMKSLQDKKAIEVGSASWRNKKGERKREGRRRGRAGLTVRRRLNNLGQTLHLDLEPTLNSLQDLLVGVRSDKRNRQTPRSEPTRSANSVEVRVGVGRLVVVDDDVDPLNVDSSTKDIGRDKDSLLERLELSVSLDSRKERGRLGKRGKISQTRESLTDELSLDWEGRTAGPG